MKDICLFSENLWQLCVPEGVGHGFVVLSGFTEFLYKDKDFLHPVPCAAPPSLKKKWHVPPAGLFAVPAGAWQKQIGITACNKNCIFCVQSKIKRILRF